MYTAFCSVCTLYCIVVCNAVWYMVTVLLSFTVLLS